MSTLHPYQCSVKFQPATQTFIAVARLRVVFKLRAIMSSESDFDIEDSDEEIVKKVTKGTDSSNAKRVMAANSPQKASKKKKIASSDEDDDYGGGDDDDDDEGDFEDTPQSGAKKTNKNKAPTSKPSAAKSNADKPRSHTVTSKSTTSTAKSEVVKTVSSSNSSSSSASSSSAAVGGGDITRGANITTESAAKKLILQYLKLQNRPYSAIQVFDNLHKRIAKPTVERCLSTLSENDGGLRCKEYGKAKIYFFDQKNMSKDFSSVIIHLHPFCKVTSLFRLVLRCCLFHGYRSSLRKTISLSCRLRWMLSIRP
jgi:TBPIP/Hop2 winged helix domain